ncbi:MAG: hypothetical protein HQK89_08885 [Nitrospirae bacterium]|nr:hypothetical protein [Nitrospirota bacterium]
MPLSMEIFEIFEKNHGREDAKTVVKSIEAAISEGIVNRWVVTKNDLLDDMKKEFATKATTIRSTN